MDNTQYTAFSQGSTVKIFNALTGVMVVSREMGDEILSCVCAGNVLTLTVKISATGRYLKVFKLPNFEMVNLMPISN